MQFWSVARYIKDQQQEIKRINALFLWDRIQKNWGTSASKNYKISAMRISYILL